MSEVAIRTKIKEVLDTLKGDGQPLVDVFDEHKTGFPGYPCATFEPVRNRNEMASTSENERHYFFEIVIHQEMEQVGRGEAIGILSSVFDSIVSELESDYSLGGTVHFCKAIEAEQGEYQEGAGWVIYKAITLECVQLTMS